MSDNLKAEISKNSENKLNNDNKLGSLEIIQSEMQKMSVWVTGQNG